VTLAAYDQLHLQMNYFNYFTEIEDEFVRRRGKHMLVSPLDWSLIETWQQRGIPLRIALRGISQSFDTYDQQPKKIGRTVNSLMYCQQAVEEAYQQYMNSQVGTHEDQDGTVETDTEPGFSVQALRDALEDWQTSIRLIGEKHQDDSFFLEALERATSRLGAIVVQIEQPDHKYLEQLDAELNLIEGILLEGVTRNAGEDKLGRLTAEAEKELKSYKSRMEKEIYLQTLKNRVAQKLRTEYGLPRLSLFNVQ
jgi:hypothetical protein